MWQRRVELGFSIALRKCSATFTRRWRTWKCLRLLHWGDANKAKVDAELRLLDDRLAASNFIAGGEYSIADITALVAIDFMKPARLELPPDLKNVKRWYDEVASRPSASA